MKCRKMVNYNPIRDNVTRYTKNETLDRTNRAHQ